MIPQYTKNEYLPDNNYFLTRNSNTTVIMKTVGGWVLANIVNRKIVDLPNIGLKMISNTCSVTVYRV